LVHVNLKLELSLDFALRYKSPAQRTRVLTQAWIGENMYCPSCKADRLEQTPEGEKVVDFVCPDCCEPFQLKSRKDKFGGRVVDAAYKPMVDAIEYGRVPSFFFLNYTSDLWRVKDLFLVPRYFISASAIERRKKLGPSAERAGWQGCNILLDRLPKEARIYVVYGYKALPPSYVRNRWRQFAFLKQETPSSRGWTADVLACVRKLGQDVFALSDVYSFEGYLSELHPLNKNVRPKIRQQLQVLRDHGIIEFLGNGRYTIR